jgi:prepilin-type processing-associated H-X9-DG protein
LFFIWLGTGIIQPWITWRRHNGTANYLYLDGHAKALQWPEAVVDMYPDKKVLTQDGSFP